MDFRTYVDKPPFGGMMSLRLVISTTDPIQDITGRYSQCVKELAGENGTVFERVLENTEVPKVYINEDVAKSLMLGLLEYFGEYRGDVKILRQDYQAERKRVDKFIEYLTRND